MIDEIHPCFKAANVKATIDWYQTVLGFAIEFVYPEEGEPCFASLRRESACIFIRESKDSLSRKGEKFLWDAYVRVSGGDLPRIYEHVKSKAPTSILRELEKTFHDDSEFDVEDCNGYVICFSEVLE